MIRLADGVDLAVEECYARFLDCVDVAFRTPYGSSAVEMIECIEDSEIFDLGFDPGPLVRYGNTLSCSGTHTLKIWGLWERVGDIYLGGRAYEDDEIKHLHDLRGVRVATENGPALLIARVQRIVRGRIYRVRLKEHHIYMTNGIWSHNSLKA